MIFIWFLCYYGSIPRPPLFNSWSRKRKKREDYEDWTPDSENFFQNNLNKMVFHAYKSRFKKKTLNIMQNDKIKSQNDLINILLASSPKGLWFLVGDASKYGQTVKNEHDVLWIIGKGSAILAKSVVSKSLIPSHTEFGEFYTDAGEIINLASIVMSNGKSGEAGLFEMIKTFTTVTGRPPKFDPIKIGAMFY